MSKTANTDASYRGRVLAPAEFRQLVQILGYHSEIGQYGVVAQMSEGMYQAISAGGYPHGGAALFITPPHWVALVVTVQVGNCQSRVVLDLHDPLAQAYLDSALRFQGLAVLLANPEEQAVAYYVAEFLRAERLAGLSPPGPLPQELRWQYLTELGAQLGRESGLITLGLALPVEEVTVTIVWPDDRPHLIGQPVVTSPGTG